MIRNLRTHRVLWLTAGLLSLAASVVGVVNPGMYEPVVSREIMPGVLSQDLMTIAAKIGHGITRSGQIYDRGHTGT